MYVFMLREILYGETYDKSHKEYTKIRERGGGGVEIHRNAWSENPPNCCALVMLLAHSFSNACLVVSQLLSSPLRWRMTYSRTGALWLSRGGAHDRLTVRELKDMMSGLPGVDGTSEAKTIFQIVFHKLTFLHSSRVFLCI
jgi:hypothetical protein